MRYILIFWALPLGLFWGWYFLSYNDMHFGYLFLSRAVHDLAFDLYGQMLGIDPEIIPGLVAKACVVDTGLIFAIYGFRRRRALIGGVRGLRARYFGARSLPSA
ncbi:DUF6105 family protein [Aquibium sp. A9E412]|uniref:DUF6105 family protein n=1 Tax=Aquibium sp. A9E412 TaxID=2976767 RepID=UPI0025B12361|nr:DUF6105 family protein [Aquibium sp. A9E412]MDN2564735.1 DUF6105 family protein [Aquibium sp. A9E412]